VSAESIRFALRNRLREAGNESNRSWNDESRTNEWRDPEFKDWKKGDSSYIDDDLLGFMSAKAAKEENTKGIAEVRRSVLEVTRAVSLTPWPGDVTFNAASVGATPSAAKKGSNNPVPYGTELHATRYQYGFAMTPERLRRSDRAGMALEALANLGEVAGNHGRFLFDFSPESIVLRLTHDPAPRILYSFSLSSEEEITLSGLRAKVTSGDLDPAELIVGGMVSDSADGRALSDKGAAVFPGIKQAVQAALEKLKS
jgi:CRISPR-associated protein Cst2